MHTYYRWQDACLDPSRLNDIDLKTLKFGANQTIYDVSLAAYAHAFD